MSLTNSLTYGYTSEEGTKELIRQIDSIGKHIPKAVFIDVGSGDGRVVNDVSKFSNYQKCIGIEVQQKWHDIAINKYPHLELYCDDVFNRPDLIKQADVVYMNCLTWPKEIFYWCFDNVRDGAIFIQNNQVYALELKRRGYDVKTFYMEANLMNKETSILIKEITET